MADHFGQKLGIQNDRQIYEDFKRNQESLRKAYAGAASKNDKGEFHYAKKSGFEKYK